MLCEPSSTHHPLVVPPRAFVLGFLVLCFGFFFFCIVLRRYYVATSQEVAVFACEVGTACLLTCFPMIASSFLPCSLSLPSFFPLSLPSLLPLSPFLPSFLPSFHPHSVLFFFSFTSPPSLSRLSFHSPPVSTTHTHTHTHTHPISSCGCDPPEMSGSMRFNKLIECAYFKNVQLTNNPFKLRQFALQRQFWQKLQAKFANSANIERDAREPVLKPQDLLPSTPPKRTTRAASRWAITVGDSHRRCTPAKQSAINSRSVRGDRLSRINAQHGLASSAQQRRRATHSHGSAPAPRGAHRRSERVRVRRRSSAKVPSKLSQAHTRQVREVSTRAPLHQNRAAQRPEHRLPRHPIHSAPLRLTSPRPGVSKPTAAVSISKPSSAVSAPTSPRPNPASARTRYVSSTPHPQAAHKHTEPARSPGVAQHPVPLRRTHSFTASRHKQPTGQQAHVPRPEPVVRRAPKLPRSGTKTQKPVNYSSSNSAESLSQASALFLFMRGQSAAMARHPLQHMQQRKSYPAPKPLADPLSRPLAQAFDVDPEVRRHTFPRALEMKDLSMVQPVLRLVSPTML